MILLSPRGNGKKSFATPIICNITVPPQSYVAVIYDWRPKYLLLFCTTPIICNNIAIALKICDDIAIAQRKGKKSIIVCSPNNMQHHCTTPTICYGFL